MSGSGWSPGHNHCHLTRQSPFNLPSVGRNGSVKRRLTTMGYGRVHHGVTCPTLALPADGLTSVDTTQDLLFRVTTQGPITSVGLYLWVDDSGASPPPATPTAAFTQVSSGVWEYTALADTLLPGQAYKWYATATSKDGTVSQNCGLHPRDFSPASISEPAPPPVVPWDGAALTADGPFSSTLGLLTTDTQIYVAASLS